MRFLDQENRAESYNNLFGRKEALEVIKAYAIGSEERTEATVREYCRSLRKLCGFEYVAEALIMEPAQERVRYFLIFATHYFLGVEVFKHAEVTAVEIQNLMRQRSVVTRLGSDPDQLKLGGRPTAKVLELEKQYFAKAKGKVSELLLACPQRPVRYRELFCEAMAFPLVTPMDLNDWLCKDLAGIVDVNRADHNLLKPSTRKLSTEKEDYIVLKSPERLCEMLKPTATLTQQDLFE